MIDRKGQTVSTLMKYIILVLVFIAIVIFFSDVINRADPATQDNICRLSVMARSKASVNAGVFKADMLTPLACPVQEIKLKGKREEIKKKIADLSAKCWWKFAEGTIPDLLKKDEYEYGCKICYLVSFDKSLDKGLVANKDNVVFTEPDRESDKLNWQEIYNYLVLNTYNPGLIYGGGTKVYMGDKFPSDSQRLGEGFDVDADLGEIQTIGLRDISSTDVRSYIMDYSFVFKSSGKSEDEQLLRIENAGAKLKQETGRNLQVIIADEFDYFEKSDGIDIIEKLKLNSNEENKDAVLIMLDLDENRVRAVIGIDNSGRIKEYEIYEIMHKTFNGVDGIVETKKALADLTVGIVEKITNVDESEIIERYTINPRSYFYYISNAGYRGPMIDDMYKGRTYAIAYVSPTNEVSWTSGIVNWVSDISLVEQLTLWHPLALQLQTVKDPGKMWEVVTGQSEKTRPNNIMIAEINKIGAFCEVD